MKDTKHIANSQMADINPNRSIKILNMNKLNPFKRFLN